jgi:hypothetical protein
MSTAITPNGPIEEASLATVEATIGTRLPEPYRSWILLTGGGTLQHRIVIPGTDDNGLLNKIDAPSALNLLAQLETHQQLIPSDYLVIAQGHGGSLTVRTARDDHGSIWWADFDKADELEIEEPSDEIMLRLADDFTTFLAGAGIDA